MTSNQAFKSNSLAYRESQIDSNQFRLLTIYPSNDPSSQLRGRLSVHTIASPPRYSTLSYAWGNITETGVLQLDAHALIISSTVENALRVLRDLEVHRIWIDQICINQQNIRERGEQVTRMKDIYANSRKCYVYLPLRNESSKGRDLSEDTRILTQWVGNYREELRATAGWGSGGDATTAWKSDSSELRRARQFMYEIMQQPYFGRLWVLQEVVFSKKLSFLIGTAQLSWDMVHALATEMPVSKIYASNTAARKQAAVDSYFQTFNELKSFAHDNADPQDLARAAGLERFSRFMELVDAVQDRNGSDNISLAWLLVKSRAFQTSDPRDKVYALLNLAPDAPRYPTADYSLSATEINRRFARCLSRQGYAPRILACSGLQISSSNPTWIPDWTEAAPELDFEVDTLFEAGLTHSIRSSETNSKALSIQTCCCDYIEEIYSSKLCRYRLFADLAALIDETTALAHLDQEDLTELIFCDPGIHGGEVFKMPSTDISDINKIMGVVYQSFDEPPEIISEFLSKRMHRITLGTRHARGNSLIHDLSTVEAFVDPSGQLAKRLRNVFPWFNDLSKLKREAFKVSETESDIMRRARSIVKSQLRDMSYFNFLRSENTSMRIFKTGRGRLGWASEMVREGDRVTIIRGARAPYILRECGDGQFNNLGQAYVRGIMMGEVLEEKRFRWKIREIV